jgi:hypothetical protein
MVAAGRAEVANANGRVKSIRSTQPAVSLVRRRGEPTPASLGGVRFTGRVRSDDHALVWWEHHPRGRDYE